jgi:hypothetical protein
MDYQFGYRVSKRAGELLKRGEDLCRSTIEYIQRQGMKDGIGYSNPLVRLGKQTWNSGIVATSLLFAAPGMGCMFGKIITDRAERSFKPRRREE